MAAAVSQSPGPAGLPGGPTGLQSRSQQHWLHILLILSENLHQPRPKKHWDINNRAVQFCYEIFHLLPHRNPAVLWFKNSRELETKPFYKNQSKSELSDFLVLRSKHGWSKEPPAWKATASNTIRKLKRKVSEKAAAAFFRLCCYRCKLKVFERAQQHAVQMEWIQEILTLKGENSSKIELGEKNRIWKLGRDWKPP